VSIGAGSTTSMDNTVSVGNSVTQRKIVQVANGTQSTDAVNVSQIQALMDSMGAGGGIRASSSVDSRFDELACTVIGICDGTGVGTVTGTESREQ
jgi:autotransporter adhesin